MNGCIQNKTTLKHAKKNGNWFRHFEDISRIYEPPNVVAYFFGPACILVNIKYYICTCVGTWIAK